VPPDSVLGPAARNPDNSVSMKTRLREPGSVRLARPCFCVRVLAVLVSTGVVSSSLLAANYYLATDGSDSNPGTIDAPFASIMQAQAAASAGDTVWLRGGTYNQFDGSTITATDANYNYVNRLSKSGIHYSAYPGETPVFDFSGVPTNRRVCGFHVTGSDLVITGIHVTGTPVGNQKQSECFRIDGSAASVDFYDCVAYNNAASGFYWTNRSRGSAIRCDAYDNIGTNAEAVGNTDGFGAHGNGVVFRYCRAWNNSDDGFDCISSPGANVFDHCWAFNHRGGGNKVGFKIGGFGADPSRVPPSPVPVHIVSYCVSAFNGARGFYANHQPGQAAVWTRNTAYNNSGGNFNMLERYSDMSADVAGYREVLHGNLAYRGTAILNDNNPPENVTNNSWTLPGVVVDAADFQSEDWTQLARPRTAGNELPGVTFMHLTEGSDLAGLGAFDPPSAPLSDARLLNLSTRALCQTDDNVLILGFVVQGTGTKRLLMRAVGPELAAFAISNPLPDPQMILVRQSDRSTVAANDNWADNTNAADIVTAAASAWAFSLDAGSASATLLMDLTAGAYTIVSSGNSATGSVLEGVAIVELYEISPPVGTTDDTRLVNLSTRGFVGVGGDIMIPGFVVSEEGSRTFLIRAVGPTLEDFSVTGTLSDPILRIYQRNNATGNEAVILANNNWGENGDADEIRDAAAAVHAFALLEGSADAACLVTLPSGPYTVHASGVGGATGVALVEVYLVP